MAFFYNFQNISYFNKVAKNIISKAALIPEVLNRMDAFYPYIIKDNERPDLIAFNEYGDETLDWVIYFSNNIVDPYYDWPLFPGAFDEYIVKKYNNSLYQVQRTISHYKYVGQGSDTPEDIARKSWLMTPTTYAITNDTAGWSPVYLYDYEVELNDAKRSIKLININYIPQLKKEIKKIFNNEL
jgi:hypothetical protein